MSVIERTEWPEKVWLDGQVYRAYGPSALRPLVSTPDGGAVDVVPASRLQGAVSRVAELEGEVETLRDRAQHLRRALDACQARTTTGGAVGPCPVSSAAGAGGAVDMSGAMMAEIVLSTPVPSHVDLPVLEHGQVSTWIAGEQFDIVYADHLAGVFGLRRADGRWHRGRWVYEDPEVVTVTFTGKQVCRRCLRQREGCDACT